MKSYLHLSLGLCLAALLTTGCGPGVSGGGDVFLGDPFFDDVAPDLIAFDDNYSTFQNQGLSVGDANGVLANDIFCCDFDIRFPSQTASGGTIVGKDDGSFVYTPPQNFTGTDFFDYVLEDEFGTSTGNVVIAVNEPPAQGFVVDNSTGSDSTGNGVSGAPFATIQAALNAAGVNGTVVVRPGTGTYSGSLTMLSGQTLVGADFQVVSPQGVVRPKLQGSVIMGDNCIVRGLEISGPGVVCVDGRGRDGGEISQCDLFNATGYAVNLDGAQGSWLFEDNIVSGNGGGLTAVLTGSQSLKVEVAFSEFRNNTQSGLLLDAGSSGSITAGLFSSVFANNQDGFSVDARAAGTSAMCMDISGNQNDDVYRLARTTALFQVEQFSQLTNLNTGVVNVVSDAIQEVSDGFCGF